MATTEILDAPDVAVIGQRLIATQPEHEHLQDARVLYLFTTAQRRRCDRVVLGTAQKANPIQRYLSRKAQEVADDEVAFAADFIILISYLDWQIAGDTEREALVYHELCHCGLKVKNGKRTWVLRGHDVEEFAAVIQRYGLYCYELRQMADAIEQLRLPIEERAHA